MDQPNPSSERRQVSLAQAPPALSEPEQWILALKALIGPPTGKTLFLDCLNLLGPAPDNRAWTNNNLSPVLAHLRSKNLLDEHLACPAGIAHREAVAALAEPAGQRIVLAILRSFPHVTANYYDYKRLDESSTRWMRLAVLLNDEQLFSRQLDLRRGLNRPPMEPIEQAFVGIDVGLEWLATRSPFFQNLILNAKAEYVIGTGNLVPDYNALIAYYRIALGQDPALMRTFLRVADDDLLQGRLTQLAALLAAAPAGLPDFVVPLYAAGHALLSGDGLRAVEKFGEALRLFLKLNHKRKGRLPGYLGLLHLAALIAADDARLHAEIETSLDQKNFDMGDYALQILLDLARNRDRAACDTAKTLLVVLVGTAHPFPFRAALAAVAVLQADRTLMKQPRAQFTALFRRYESSLPLVAGMLAEVLERIADDPAPYRAYLARPGNEVQLRFTRLIAAKESWDRALSSVEAMLAPAKIATTASAPKRLIWLVDPDTAEIQPLEQSAQARGWSAGRNVALKRLHRVDPKIDYLDDHDRRVVRTIRLDTSGWGGDFYAFAPEITLPALVGHPRVFDSRRPTQPVDLISGRAEIVLSTAPRGFRLSLSHLAAEPAALIEVEAPDRWRVVSVDAKAVAVAAILGSKGLEVPAAARDRLLALARANMPGVPLRIEAAELDDGSVEDGDPQTVLRLAPIGEGLKLSLVVRPCGPDGPYFLPGRGGRLINAHIGETAVRRRRDLPLEKQLAQALIQACPTLDGAGLDGEHPDWLLEDRLAALEFLAELQSLPQPPPIEWPAGQKLALRGTATAKQFKARIKSAENWFGLGGDVVIDEDLVLDLRDLLARLDRAEGRFVPLSDGGYIALDRHFRAQLERLKLFGDDLKIPTMAAASVREMLDQAGSASTDARWKQFIRRIDEAEDWQPTLPGGFEAELRDYQSDGFAWMARLARWGAGACLADDMGLGKTVQAIGMLLSRAAQGPCLVVAPTSVCGNWATELQRFAPSLRLCSLADSGDRDEILGALGPGVVLIASYGLLVRQEEGLTAINWSMAVLDEAQAIKNAETQRAKVCAKLNAGFRLALTGTPVENDLDELWSLFRFVNPGLLGGRDAFGRRFATPIERDNSAEAKSALKSLIKPFLLRRAKATVLAELPARTEQTLLVEMGEEERAFYEALRQRALERLADESGPRTRIHILAEITKLRQACCHPALATPGATVPAAKLETLLELIEELRLNHHRALIFSQFVGHLGKVRAALDERKIVYQYLDGSTPARERDKIVAAFQTGEGELFLISLKAGGFGLNLTAADYVVHLDPWWNPAVEDQASDRAHRIGQLRPVTIYRLIMKDSIEEGILALHRRKRDLADALLEGADASAKLSEEDLLNLIRGA